MFFLFRMAFWLGLVCVLLPSGGAKTNPDAQIDAGQAVTLAGAAVSDMSGFCDRQPAACKTGGKVAVALGHKAEAGARKIFEFVTAKLSEKSEPAAKSAAPNGKVVAVSTVDHGTLRSSDLAPVWHGPVPLPPRRYVAPARPFVSRQGSGIRDQKDS
jgi:hypothetical protein